MNLSIFKDKKLTLSLIIAFVSSIIAIITTIIYEDSRIWLLFFLVCLISLSYGTNRADKLYREKDDNPK